MNKLNSPLTKSSFQSPTNTEYFPVENFIRRDSPVQNFDPDQTPTNFDSGFNEASSGGRDNPPPVQTHLSSGSRTRSSTPCPQHNSRIPLDRNLSPLRPNTPDLLIYKLQKIIIIIGELLVARPSRHHAIKPDLFNFVLGSNKSSQHLLAVPITTTHSLNSRLEALKKEQDEKISLF